MPEVTAGSVDGLELTVHVDSVVVVVVDDCLLVRDALVGMLQRCGWTKAVLGASTLEEAARHCRDDLPDVVLVGAGGTLSLSELRQLHERFPTTPLVALAVGTTDQHVIECAQAGVAGMLDRAADDNMLKDTVLRVLRGEIVCTPAMTTAILRRLAAEGSTHPSATVLSADNAHLTPREREVLVLIERGWTNKQIASELGIEVRTVKNHVHQLLDKLRVSRRGEAAARLRTARVPSIGELLGESAPKFKVPESPKA